VDGGNCIFEPHTKVNFPCSTSVHIHFHLFPNTKIDYHLYFALRDLSSMLIDCQQ
jgi:hypothetical protein